MESNALSQVIRPFLLATLITSMASCLIDSPLSAQSPATVPSAASKPKVQPAVKSPAKPAAKPAVKPADAPVAKPSSDAPADADMLQRLVAQRDDAYSWKIEHKSNFSQCEVLQLQLVSQRWQGILWRHTVYVVKPENAESSTRNALMWITGGAWDPQWGEQGPGKQKMPREATILAMLANQLKSPIVVVRQIPFQPMFDGLYEDALIAATFAKYMKTGDPSWPLLPAMARAGSRAIDAATEVADEQWGMKLDSFTVLGASKRGWTTYLLGATDKRVKAIAPMVIDMLNLPQQMRHQLAAWGDYSPQIGDYSELRLQEALQTPRGKSLLPLIDPYLHRQKLTMPKLVILGTNDPYWPVDASRYYYNDLSKPKGLLIIPNNAHGLTDLPRMVGSIAALHHSVIHSQPLPDWHGTVEPLDGNMTITAAGSQSPTHVYAWTARAETRDFRKAKWNARSLPVKDREQWQLTLEAPESGFVAGMIEAQFAGPIALPLSLTTEVTVVPDQVNQPSDTPPQTSGESQSDDASKDN